MTDTEHPDHSNLSSRKRQAIFRATHRGTREMDILLGGFVEREIHSFSDAEMENLYQLLEAPDWDIYKWVTGTLPVPENYDTPLFRRWSTYQNAKSGEMRNL
ncbi:MAG: succinate dehydrogenase assembly factor 2 [Hyphomicrobiales bacterium]